MMILKTEVSKRFYSSKAKSSNVHYFALPIGAVNYNVGVRVHEPLAPLYIVK